VAGARTLAGRFAATFGDALVTPFDSLTTLFPVAERVAALAPGRIARIGMPGARARTVIALARAVADARLVLTPNADVEATLDALRALPGVGEWTAQYIALRQLREPDAFPASDIALIRAIAKQEGRGYSAAELLSRADPWRPWRAYAAQHLWSAA
jgi:AraC family transcriptional regulator, regulatory protein of adaptative response / DNA-3-methyladenine glycosylase II